jgi:SAM-dependent methyltransferase
LETESIVRILPFLLRLLTIGWLSAAALWLLLRYWLRGPCPYRQRWLLDNLPRRLIQPVSSMVEGFHLAPGSTVLELGAGTGYFSIEAARRLGPEGRLLCLDIQPLMAAFLRGRLLEEGVANAHPVVADAMSLPLADDSGDVAFLVTVLGEVPDRSQALSELRRVLKPGGVLSVTETLPDPDYQSERTVRGLCAANGFLPLERFRRPLGFTLNFVAPAGYRIGR